MRCPTCFLLTISLLAPFEILAQNDTPKANDRSSATLRELSGSLETLSARVRPAVVQIFSTGYVTSSDENEGTTAQSLLSTQRSTGSGVILSSDGYIITNNHVVQGARRVEVKLAAQDASRVRMQEGTLLAKVIGVDRETDLAVIKIERTGLSQLTLGDSNALRQGQLVIAFGNPLGLEGSVTMGVVSSISRELKPDDPTVYVQTDAPINPGNSGGPLVDVEGHVVGLNTLIISQSGGSEGIGFAIPSNTVRNVYDQIRKDGHVHRGQIGVMVQTITPLMAKGLDLKQTWGVVISDVQPDGPADKAGVKVGDIVVTLDGREMADARQLETTVYRHALDDQLALGVKRGDETLNFTIPVIEREDDPQRFADMVNPEDNLVPKLGILAIQINDKLASLLPDLRHDFGVVVAARSPNAPYAGGGLEPGDVIYQINQKPVVSVKGLRDALETLKAGDAVVLQVERNSKLRYITIELE